MASPGTIPCSVIIQALTVFSLIAVSAVDLVQGGDDGCPSFSCGHLQNISSPFRRRGDPLGCGVGAYELVCTSSKAAIYINTGTYYVTAINYIRSNFLVIDANFDTNSICPLPLWNHLPKSRHTAKLDSHGFLDFETQSDTACFANCSRAVTNNSAYKPVACLSAGNSHVYVWVNNICIVDDLEPYCGYLAMIPFGEGQSIHWLHLHDASYAVINQLIAKGFTVSFPMDTNGPSASEKLRKNINLCLNDSTRLSPCPFPPEVSLFPPYFVELTWYC